jgi:hypothetical protein
MPALVEPPISDVARTDDDWKLVEQLILDLEGEEKPESLLQTLFCWRAAMRAFRKVEFRRMRFADATQQDLRWHSLILSRLIAMGEAILIDLDHSNYTKALETCGVNTADVEAAVAMLKHNWEEWHAHVSQTEAESLKQKIFGGQA